MNEIDKKQVEPRMLNLLRARTLICVFHAMADTIPC